MHGNGLQKITFSIFRSLRQKRTRCPKPLMTLNRCRLLISGVPFKNLGWSAVVSTNNTCPNNPTWQILQRHVLSKTGPPNNHPPRPRLPDLPPTLPDHQTSYSSNDQILIPSGLSVSEVLTSSFSCSRMSHISIIKGRSHTLTSSRLNNPEAVIHLAL